jgi:hypothetical protein
MCAPDYQDGRTMIRKFKTLYHPLIEYPDMRSIVNKTMICVTADDEDNQNGFCNGIVLQSPLIEVEYQTIEQRLRDFAVDLETGWHMRGGRW